MNFLNDMFNLKIYKFFNGLLFLTLLRYFLEYYFVGNELLKIIFKFLNISILVLSSLSLKTIFERFLINYRDIINSKYIENLSNKIKAIFYFIIIIFNFLELLSLFDLTSEDIESDIRILMSSFAFIALIWEIFLKDHKVTNDSIKVIKLNLNGLKVPDFISSIYFKLLVFSVSFKYFVKFLNFTNFILRKRELFLNNFYLFKTLDFFILIFTVIILKRVLDMMVNKIKMNSKKENTLPFIGPLVSNTGKILITIIFIISFFNLLGYNILFFKTNLLLLPEFIKSLGVLGFGLSFLAKDTIGNFISGIFILSDAPFAIGDRIKAGEVEGEVEEIGIRTTKLRTRFNTIITVPNSLLTSQAVTSFRKYGREIRIYYDVAVSYKSDVKKVKKILMDVAKEQDIILNIPEPIVHLSTFNQFSITFTVIYWIRDVLDRFEARNRLNIAIIEQFKVEGIKIPYPIYDIHIKNENTEK